MFILDQIKAIAEKANLSNLTTNKEVQVQVELLSKMTIILKLTTFKVP